LNPVSSAGSPPTNPSTNIPKPLPLNSADFLKILVAEFRNQDPTSPSDPTQYASQLVQFANLGQLEKIDNNGAPQPANALMQAASAFIGREVVTAGSLIGLKGGKATSLSYVAPAADSYTARVYDAAGNLVDTVSLGDQSAGSLESFAWTPPKNASDGQYSVAIAGSKGASATGMLERGVVQSVSLSNAGVALDLGNLIVTQSQVASVAQPQSN
jgi:flagellar basal-body rod modification protein FlgD